MADSNGYVAYLCSWCGEKFHDETSDHCMHPRAIYNDYDGNQYCTTYCRDMATKEDEP